MFTRICPKCSKELVYKNQYNLKSAINKKSLCRSCTLSNLFSGKNNPFYGKTHSTETTKLISQKRKGQRNSPSTEFGRNGIINRKSIYQCWLERYGKEEADKRLLDFKRKQSVNNSGSKNSMYGKPSPIGSGAGWSGWYNGIYFRSLRELSLLYYLIRNNINFVTTENKKYAIKYIDIDGKERNYFPDYLINNKILVEVKPRKLLKSDNNKLKFDAAFKYCLDNNLKYKITEPKIIDKKILIDLFLSGKITFIKKYNERMLKLCQS